MEPNDNIQNNNDSINGSRPVKAPGFANEGVGSGDASGGATHVDGGKDVVFQDKPKKGHGMLYGMILLAILAAGGIGFGVWAMLDGNSRVQEKDEQIKALNTQLEEKNDEVVEDSTVVDIETTEDDDVVSASNSKDYIYIGEWALKIKIPENLTITGYEYSMLAGYTSVSITGNTKGGQYLPGFADMNKDNAWLGVVLRYPKGTEMSPLSPPSFVFADEQYDYYYSHPQMVVSMDEDERNWEIESSNAFEQMLTNKDNYSAI